MYGLSCPINHSIWHGLGQRLGLDHAYLPGVGRMYTMAKVLLENGL